MPEEDVVMFRYLQMWLYTDSFLEAGEKLLVVPWRTLIDIYGQYMEYCGIKTLGLLIHKYNSFRRDPPYTRSPECHHERHIRQA